MNRSTEFKYFRFLLGLYLTYYFACLLPYANELFGRGTMAGNQILGFSLFPNLLGWIESYLELQIFLTVLMILSLMFATGLAYRWWAIPLWYGWTCLLNQNPLISYPAIAFTGWLLLASVLVPHPNRKDWEFPKLLSLSTWILLGTSYFHGGVLKLLNPSWKEGSAIAHLLHSPLATEGILIDILNVLPSIVLSITTWGFIASQLLIAPLLLFHRTRPIGWMLGFIIQGLALGFSQEKDLAISSLLMHLFCLNSSLFVNFQSKTERIVFFDGICNLCNGFISFLFDQDNHDQFKVGALQGETAKEKLPACTERIEVSSIVLYEDGATYTRSTAALKILNRLGGIWAFTLFLWIFPKPIRDSLYNFIAKNRYRWFGKRQTCRLPTEGEWTKFLP